MEYTHIAVTYRATSADKSYEMLFRYIDGAALGQCKAVTVVFGEGKNRDSRVFIDHEHAARFLRGKVAMDDLKANGLEGPVVIEEREGFSGGLYMPDDSMEMPHPGIAKMN